MRGLVIPESFMTVAVCSSIEFSMPRWFCIDENGVGRLAFHMYIGHTAPWLR
jgi:hypothetical protein